MPAPNLPPPLHTLFLLLESGGFPVTPRHYLMLAHVYALAPEGGGEQLRRVLRSLLVKYPEERERFDRLFDQWLGETGERLSRMEPRAEPPALKSASYGTRTPVATQPARKPKAGRRRRTPLLFAAAAAALLTLALALQFCPPEDGSGPGPDPGRTRSLATGPRSRPPMSRRRTCVKAALPSTCPTSGSSRLRPLSGPGWPPSWLAWACWPGC